jgi:hypothetical protein
MEYLFILSDSPLHGYIIEVGNKLYGRRFVEIVESNILSSLYSYKKMGSSYNGLSIICTVLNCTVYLQHRIKERRKMKKRIRKLFLCAVIGSNPPWLAKRPRIALVKV